MIKGEKGQGIIGVGRLVNESWEDGSGTKRYGTKVELERAHYVSAARQTPTKSAPKLSREEQSAPPSPILEEEFPPEVDLPF